jgi:hypothetical protein
MICDMRLGFNTWFNLPSSALPQFEVQCSNFLPLQYANRLFAMVAGCDQSRFVS